MGRPKGVLKLVVVFGGQAIKGKKPQEGFLLLFDLAAKSRMAKKPKAFVERIFEQILINIKELLRA